MIKNQRYQWKHMTMGVCYYPEHWPAAGWASDLSRMLDAGISTIRIAEFAWNLCEPEEGRFTFDFFQNFLDLCADKGMKVIFGTPTATPPAWLTEKYPEVLNGRRDGVLYRHGCRRHYNYNSPVYQRLSARIVRQLASHYAAHPAIVGWQIDNELNCETAEFYSEADSIAFRDYLRHRFGTLDALNQALGTIFWNQTYTDWNQLYVPRPTLNNTINPHLMLEYYRFVSESAIRFCKMQSDIIREYTKPGDFITTNGMFPNLDNHRMTREALDVYTYDSYPNFAYGIGEALDQKNNLRDRRWSRNLTNVRSICPHFGIMEQQSGANGWNTRMEAPAPRPGQLSLWAMQSVAHGADYVSFFRWRTCTFGTEIYWHGILDYDGRDNRKLAEVKDFYAKLQKIDAVCGADVVAPFALLKDYDNEWDAQLDVWHSRVLEPSTNAIFAASTLTHTPYNVVYMGQPGDAEQLKQYPVAIYPHPLMMDEARAATLRAYVEQGGTLIIGCRAGYKDLRGQCVMMPQPGLLASLTGTDVHDFTFTSGAEEPCFALMDGQRMDAPVFNDVLTPLEGTRVLASYGTSYYQDEAALTEHRLGRGRVLHWGSTFTRENVEQLLALTGVLAPFADVVEAPEEIELVMREKAGKRYLFALNYQPTPIALTLKCAAVDLYTGDSVSGEYTLPAFGTAVFAL